MKACLRVLCVSGTWLLSCLASSDSVVVFNEIMYHPATTEEAEWIELHNQMSIDIDLSRWRLQGGVDYTFPEGTIITGGGYLLVSSDDSAVEGALGPWAGSLDNGGERLRLMSASNRLMNEVRYNDRGAWPIAPDGSGVSLSLIHSDASAQEASHWSWSAEIGGTPGAVNFSGDRIPEQTLVINELSAATEEGAWVELYNRGDASINLDGTILAFLDTGVELALPAAILAPRAHFLIEEATTLPKEPLILYGPQKKIVLDAIDVEEQAQARFPDGSQNIFHVLEVTPGQLNEFVLHEDIVINEIFYRHRPQYAEPSKGIDFAEIDEEWIELFHRGDLAVDLSGWSITGDIRHDFPEGTIMDPGAYLVIQRGKDDGFEGRLSNRSGQILLRDALGNPADEVTFHDDGEWPTEADGGGSSLELRDPFANNDHAMAWAASDESARSEWQKISYRGEAQRSVVGPDNQWSELVIGLLDRGELLIDDIQVIEDPDGEAKRLISNSAFQTTIFGGSALRTWRPIGTHRHSEVVPDPEDPSNTVLKVVATGPTGHMHNHIETTLASGARIANGTTYEISFRTRAISGSPQLHTRLYFNRLAKTHIIQLPAGGGTPGQPNSRLEPAGIGPTMSQLRHTPAVPAPNQPCAIRVRAEDPNGVEFLTAFWSVGTGVFTESPMSKLNDTDYEFSIPGQAADAIVQFYIAARDTVGQVSFMPPLAEQSRALYQVGSDDRLADPVLNHFRIIVRPDDVEWMHDAINLMSNDRVPATVIYKENQVFYNVGVRLKGSERGRVTNQRIGFNVKFPNQQRFRGIHRTVAIDRSEGVGTGQFELLFNQMMTHSGGIPAEYNDLIHVITPRTAHSGPAELQLARYGSLYLDSQFEDGSDGNLYEYELIYYPTTTDAEKFKRPQPDSVLGTPVRDLGDNKEQYRWNYLLRSNQHRDEFGSIMRFAKLFSKADEAFQAELEQVVAVDGWLQGMAFALLSGAGDQYGANSQHNGMFYQRPDGRIICFPHDLDFAFSSSRSITENTELKKIIKNDAHKRTYLAHVNNILTTTFNESYMTRWAEHFGKLLPRQNFKAHLGYVVSRSKNAQGQVNRMAPDRGFNITTNNGADLTTNDSTITLEGKGGLDIYRLRHVETGTDWTPTWTGLDSWQLTLPVPPGITSTITLQGINVLGTTGSLFAPVGKDTISITSTAGPAATGSPVTSITEAPNGNLIISYPKAGDDTSIHTLEVSTDLQQWTDAKDISKIETDTEIQLNSIKLNDTLQSFLRLKITQ